MADSLTLDQQKALAMAAARKRQAEATPTEAHPGALMRGAAERMLGTEELINNLGVGKHIGLPSNEILEGATNIAKEQGHGTGITGTLEEMAGDPLSYIGGAELKGAQGALGLAKAGAKYGGLAGSTETGAKDIKGNLKNAAIGATAGAVLTPAIPAAARGIGKTAGALMEGYGARTPEVLKQVAASIRDEADTHYDTMRKENAHISPQAVKTLQSDVAQELQKQGLWNKRLHGDTMSVLTDLQKASANGLNLETLDQHRRLLSSVVNKNIRSNPEDAKRAMAAIRAIDDVVDKLNPSDLTTNSKTAVEALQKARATWSKARKFEMISDIIEKSNGDPNRMKALFEQLANNKNKTRGFTPEEKKALKEVAENTTTEGLMKMAGKFGITLGHGRSAATGNVLPAAELLIGGFKKGLPVVAGASGAKYAQGLLAKAKAERLLKLIEQGKITPQQAMGGTTNPLYAAPVATKRIAP